MNSKTDRALEAIKVSFAELLPKYAHQAYENCTHPDKWKLSCSKEQLCTTPRLVAWFWGNDAKWN